MKKRFVAATIAGLATGLPIGTATADVLIFLRQVGVNGGDPTLVATGTNAASFSGSYGSFFTVNLAAGFAPTDPLLLHSALATSVGTIPSGDHPQLVVSFYVTGLAPLSSSVQPFSSTFNSSIQGSISQNMSVYVNPRNDTAPGDETFVGGTGEFRPGGPPPMILSESFVALSAPYSLVGLFLINTLPGEGGTSFATIDVSNVSSVPTPIVGAGLPGLLMTIAGFIGWRRSLRK